FLMHEGRSYDSKAIVGAAHGYEHPQLGPLGAHDFSGGETTVARKLEALGFAVRRTDVPQRPDTDTPLVLVENEATVGGRYDDWKDVTGERYHFPNQYRNRVIPGRPFVYYRGSRRAHGRRGQPEDFGYGTIGDVWRDPDVPTDAPKRDWHWFCAIDEYQLFPYSVPAKQI